MQAAARVAAAGMRNEFVGETAARQGRLVRGCFCPQCGQVNHKLGALGRGLVGLRAVCLARSHVDGMRGCQRGAAPHHPDRAGNNNHMTCWSCTSPFCYQCRAVLRGRGAGGAHFGARGCKQHSAD